MAEFQEVMKQWVRVRKATASRHFDEDDVLSVYPLEAYDDALIADIEKNVMQWAAEHPEPVYPTWAEWLTEQKIITAAKSVGTETMYDTVLPMPAMFDSIPADVAEALKIPPKEG